MVAVRRRLLLVVVVLALLVYSAVKAECVTYMDGDLSYCNAHLRDRLVADRNFPAAAVDAAARLTAQVLCNQDWAAGAFVVGGEYGDGILDSEVCVNQGSQCQDLARLLACTEAAGNKGVGYYDALRDPTRLSEEELGNYERAPARIADPLWRAELGGDCPNSEVLEPTPQACCDTLRACNATTVQIGGYTASPSDFCSSIIWADGQVVVCGEDGTARLLSSAAAVPSLAWELTAALVAATVVRLIVFAER